MNKRIIALIFLFVLISTVMFGCETKDILQEEELMKAKAVYAERMFFYCNVENLLTSWSISTAYYEGNYKDIVFVNSESQAAEDDVLAVWPSENTERVLHNLNDFIQGQNEDVELEQFSLKAPITLTDAMENWENVNAFLDSLSISRRAYILDPSNALSGLSKNLD